MLFLLTVINFFGLVYVLYVLHSLKENLHIQSKSINVISEKEIHPVSEAPVYRGESKGETVQNTNILERFIVWFARDWPLKVGTVFILLGFVWLVTYAFLNNWIGPTGRILFGICTGSAVLLWGSKRILKNIYQGEIITGLGAGIILISIFSAQFVYTRMFSPVFALGLVAAVSLLVAYISFRNNTMRLALLGYGIGAAAPLLTASSQPDVLGLFSYLFCLTVAAIWLVRVTGWRIILISALLVIWLYSIPWFTMYISPSNLIYMRFFAVVFTILFYSISLTAFTFDRIAHWMDALAGTLIGLYALHWIIAIIAPEYQTALCVLFAIGFMTGAYVVYHIQKAEYPVYLYTMVSILFLLSATFIQFEGNVLPMVLATEALALTIFADTVYGPRMLKWMVMLFILPLIYAIPLLTGFSKAGDSGTLIYIIASVFIAGIYLMLYSKINSESVRLISKILICIGGIYALVFLWVAMPYYFGYKPSVFNDYYRQYYPSRKLPPAFYNSAYGIVESGRNIVFTAHAVTLTLYSILGIFLNMYGIRKGMQWTKRFGFWLACAVIARLLLIEVWSMSLTARIVTFFAIGIIFIFSVFIRRSTHETK